VSDEYESAIQRIADSGVTVVRAVTPESFREMVKRHDLTFDYSDDGEVWRSGNAALAAIREAAKSLERAAAVQIWNSVVDEKILSGHREHFYWKP
jgi:hypothetical protein